MATAVAAAKGPKELTSSWEGKDKAGKVIRGELRAVSEAAVNATLRRQGILVQKVKPLKRKGGGKVGSKDIALFTRQLATMMKAGVPLLQSFEIVGKGASNPAAARLGVGPKADAGARAVADAMWSAVCATWAAPAGRPVFSRRSSTASRCTRRRSSPSSRRSR